MSDTLLEWRKWFEDPLDFFFEKLNTLDPEKLRGTNRFKYVTWGFRGLYFDIIMMFRLIAQIMRGLDRDLLNLIKMQEKHAQMTAGQRVKWTPSDQEDEKFNVLFLAQIDFSSLIIFYGILLEKIARLLHNITIGNRPGPRSFTDWRNKIITDKFVVPNDLKKLMKNTIWYDEFDKLRNKYTIHSGYSIGGIINYSTFQLLSHEEKEITYKINNIENLSKSIYLF
ncbi:MAG: hypothetical protein V1915_02245 [Candidatus Bathyarchaeota archaeon]